MKKILRNSILLSAFLLMALMVNATVIGGGATGTTTNPTGNVAGCEDPKKELKRIDCQRATPVYACGTDGTAEACVTAQTCPAN